MLVRGTRSLVRMGHLCLSVSGATVDRQDETLVVIPVAWLLEGPIFSRVCLQSQFTFT